jgi:hypothetical protein
LVGEVNENDGREGGSLRWEESGVGEGGSEEFGDGKFVLKAESCVGISCVGDELKRLLKFNVP